MRTFKLFRKVDDSGVSGTGYVAEGAQFHDGQVCLAWFSTVHAMAIYPNIDDLVKIHGHGGHTTVVWDDEERYRMEVEMNKFRTNIWPKPVKDPNGEWVKVEKLKDHGEQ